MKDDDDNIVDVLFIQLTWLEIDAYLEWLIELELWKLKSESKDLLLVAFLAKTNPSSQKALHV